MQVGMARAGYVRLRELLPTGCGVGQAVAAINHHQGLLAVLQGEQLRGRYQGLVLHDVLEECAVAVCAG